MPVQALWQAAKAAFHGQPGAEKDAQRLAQHQRYQHGYGRGLRGCSAQVDAGKLHARIGQRKNGHDTKRNPGVKNHRQAQSGWQQITLGRLCGTQVLQQVLRIGLASVHLLAGLAHGGLRSDKRWLFGRAREHRRHQAQHHAGQCGVGTGLEQTKPQHRAGQQIQRRSGNAHAVEQQHQQHARTGNHKAHGLQTAGVEEGNDEYGHDVINDGQRQQKDAQRGWDVATQQSQYAHGKRNVGCRGNGPAVEQSLVAARQRHIDERGYGYAAHGGHQRQTGLAQAGQRAVVQLAPDFHANDQKEGGHQHIVDDEMQVGAEAPGPQRHGDGGVPQGEVAFSVAGVGPDQRCSRSQHEHHAGKGFDMQQMSHFCLHALGRSLQGGDARRVWGCRRRRGLHKSLWVHLSIQVSEVLCPRCVKARGNASLLHQTLQTTGALAARPAHEDSPAITTVCGGHPV